jgi:two-component system response regulator NreC
MLRIVLIAPEPVFRSGFRSVVESSGDLHLIADAPDARNGFPAVDREKPEVVVVAVALPGMNGIAATRELRRRAPDSRVLLLAEWPRERDVLEGLAAGARGFALTTQPVEALLAAIRAVGAGQLYLPPDVRGIAAGAAPNGHARGSLAVPGDVLVSLSPREREVLDLVVKGWRNREIARELCVSIKTVDTHRTHINRKLRCGSTSDLVRFAAENGLLPRAPSATATSALPRTIVLHVDAEAGEDFVAAFDRAAAVRRAELATHAARVRLAG